MMNAKRIKFHLKFVVSLLAMMFCCLWANNTLDAQTYYNNQQALSVLKSEINTLENSVGLTKQQTSQTNLNLVKLAYLNAVANSIGVGMQPAQAIEENYTLMTASGTDSEYSGFTPISKTEANVIKDSTIDLLSE